MRTALLYVGLSVGAGFATGKEINIYFNSANIISLIISGLMTSFFCYVFLTVGRLSLAKGNFIKKGLQIVYGVGGIAFSSVMLSCISEIFELKGLSVIIICSMLCMTLALNSSKAVKLFTGASVPVIIICCLIVAVRCNKGVNGGELKPVESIKYSAMNIFFQCAYITKEGEKLTRKEGVLTSIMVGILITFLLIPMYSVARGELSSIPFISVASTNGLSYIAIVEVLFAILTTITSCYSLSLEISNERKSLWVFVVMGISILGSTLSFDSLVSVVYPVLSTTGLIILFCALIGIVNYNLKKGIFRMGKKCKLP